jgi:hypothetical protein
MHYVQFMQVWGGDYGHTIPAQNPTYSAGTINAIDPPPAGQNAESAFINLTMAAPDQPVAPVSVDAADVSSTPDDNDIVQTDGAQSTDKSCLTNEAQFEPTPEETEAFMTTFFHNLDNWPSVIAV